MFTDANLLSVHAEMVTDDNKLPSAQVETITDSQVSIEMSKVTKTSFQHPVMIIDYVIISMEIGVSGF